MRAAARDQAAATQDVSARLRRVGLRALGKAFGPLALFLVGVSQDMVTATVGLSTAVSAVTVSLVLLLLAGI